MSSDFPMHKRDLFVTRVSGVNNIVSIQFLIKFLFPLARKVKSSTGLSFFTDIMFPPPD